MFDVLVAAEPRTSFAAQVANALRNARLRVIAHEMAATDPPPTGFSVDAAVACAEQSFNMGVLARGIRAGLEGPPPVVGITRGAAVAPAGVVDLLPADAPDSLVVARVQQAAATRERDRSRTLLSGDVAGVGLRALLLSLASRRRTGVLRVRADARRAELAIEGGVVTHARADGVASRSLELVLGEVESWRDAVFELLGRAEPAPSLAFPLDAAGKREPHPVDDSDVALAAAVMNAVAAYARAFLPSNLVAEYLEHSRLGTRSLQPSIDAFAVSQGGMVSVTRLSLAKAAVPDALGEWCSAFFEECSRTMPSRFKSGAIPDVLGGLTRLIEKVGWSRALFRAGAEEETP